MKKSMMYSKNGLMNVQTFLKNIIWQKINEYKINLINENTIENEKKYDITSITNEHHEQLKALRLLFDNFLKNVETQFFDVL